MKNSSASISELASKEGIDATTYVTRLRGALRSAGEEGFKKGSKEYKEYFKAVDQFTDLRGLDGSASIMKQNRWIESIGDGLGLPTQLFKLGAKDGKRTVSASFMGLGLNAAIPGSTLLPGVGEWFETTGLRMGGVLASMYVNQTRTGLIETERQKFLEKYGVDPEESKGNLRAKWDEQLNYKLRYSLPSEILTGESFAERSNAGKALWGTVDMIANFAPVMGGIKTIGKTYEVSQKYLSPIHMEDNGNITSNLGFIRELTDIQNSDLNEASKAQKIEMLKEEVAKGNPNFVTTIRGTKELENTVKELQEYFHAVAGGKNDIMASAYIKNMQDVVGLIDSGNMDGALAKWKEGAIEQSQIGQNILSSDALNKVNQKVDVLNTYFQKVRSDHGFLSNLTKQFVVNAFTTNVKSPTGAVIRGNEDLIASAKSIYSELDNMAKVMEDTFSAKGNYIKNKFPGKAGEDHVLDSRIETALKVAGLEPTKEMVVAFRFPLVTALTKTQFEMKEFQDSTIEKIFDSVFSDYGLDVKKIGDEGGKSIGEIIMEINSMNMDEVIKISSRIEESMNAKVNAKKLDLQSQQQFLQSNALQIAQMDRLYSELTNQLHVQRSRERIEDNPFIKTEEIPLRDEIEILKAEIAELKKNKQDTKVEEEQLKKAEDFIQKDPDATVFKDTPTDLDPNDSPTAAKIIATEEVQKDIVAEAEKTWQIFASESKQVDAQMENLAQYILGIKRSNDALFNRNAEIIKDNVDIDEMDEMIDKEVDNYYKNKQRLEEYSDLFFRGIADEYNKTAKNHFEKKGEIDLDTLKQFNSKKNKILSKELDKIKAELLGMAVDGKIPKNGKSRFLIQKGNQLINSAKVNNFNREGIIDIAVKSNDVFDFMRNLQSGIRDNFKFTDEAISAFMKNQFDIDNIDEPNLSKIIPFYELYKKQEKIEVIRMNFDVGEVETTNIKGEKEKKQGLVNSKDYPHYSSRTNDGLAYDENGNSKLIRTRGIGSDKLKEKGEVVYLEDIYVNGKSLDGYWSQGIWGGKNIKEVDRVDFFENVIMAKVREEAEKQGLLYIGDFQEEGKKTVFIRPKDPSYTWEEAMFDLTGIDWNEINNLPDGEMKNSIAGNFQKYAKLIWWGEINASKSTWEQFIKIDETVPELWKNKLHTLQGGEELIATLSTARDAQVRHLLYNDEVAKPQEYMTESEKAAGKEIIEKTSDGRTFNMAHYGNTLNATTGATPHNDIQKTATNLGRGQFIKSQDKNASLGNFSDPQVVDAMYKSDDPKIKAIVDFTLANFGDRWFDNIQAVETVRDLFQDFRVIDRIIPMSAYKNIFTRGKYLKQNVPSIQFENHSVGSIISTDISNIGVKAIDFSHSPKDLENENIKYANQVTRNIHEIRDKEGNILFSQEKANKINHAINEIRQKDFDDVMDYADRVGYDPFLVIGEIEERFGVKFSSYQKEPFINSSSAENLTKLISNIVKRGTTSGTLLKGNQADLTYPPNYWRIEHIVQQLIEPEFEHNFIILSKKFYGHIDTDRVMMFRYPVVSDKVPNAPKIVWVEDIEAQLGYKLDLGSSVVPSIHIIKKIEGDGDGDKVVLVNDKRLEKVRPLIEEYIDVPKFQFEVSNTDSVDKNVNRPIREILNRTSYDIFYGKTNIGIIDNDQTRVEKLMQMGLIPNDKLNIGNRLKDPYNPGKYFTGYRHDAIRQVMAITLQRAVDSKAIDLGAINEMISNSVGFDIKYFNGNKKIVTSKNVKGEKINLGFKDPDGKTVFLWTVKTVDATKETQTILEGWVSMALNRDDGIFQMNPQQYADYKKISADFLVKGINEIQAILKKNKFLSDTEKKLGKDDQEDIKNKSVKLLRSEYIKVKKMYDELVGIYGKSVIDADPQMAFIGTMEGSFLREFPGIKIKENIELTLSEAFGIVKDATSLEKNERELLSLIKKELQDYNKWDKEETKEGNNDRRLDLEKIIFDTADMMGVENLDNIIRHSASSTTSPLLELMTSEGKKKLFSEVTDNLVYTNLIRLGKEDGGINLSRVWENFGKVKGDELIEILKEDAGDKLDDYFDPKRRLMRNKDLNPTIKSMVDFGMSIKELYDFSESVSNLETPVRERVVDSIKNLEEGDIKAFLEIAKDGDMGGAVELLTSFGYKDLAGDKLVKKTQDAYNTVINSPFNKPNC